MHQKVLEDYNSIDIIPGKVEPDVGSIKIIKIDGILSEKHFYDGKKWKPVCKFKNCTEDPDKCDLCFRHYNFQLKINVDGERVTKGLNTYKWTINEWKLMCCVKFCENYATSKGTCKIHNKDKPTTYSSNQTLSSIYNLARQEILIRKEKLKKLQELRELQEL